MELTITYYCDNIECVGNGEEQTDTIKIRRGQRVFLKCGYCKETAVVIQGNRKPK